MGSLAFTLTGILAPMRGKIHHYCIIQSRNRSPTVSLPMAEATEAAHSGSGKKTFHKGNSK